MAAGDASNNPILWKSGEADLTEEEYIWFVKRWLIAGTSPTAARSARVVVDGTARYADIPSMGYLTKPDISTDPFNSSYALQRFKDQIFKAGAQSPPFKGVRNRINLPTARPNVDPLDSSMKLKKQVLKDHPLPDQFTEYLERFAPVGVMYFQKPVNALVPTWGPPGGAPDAWNGYGKKPLFWPPTDNQIDYTGDKKKPDVKKLVESPETVGKRFDCMVVLVNRGYLRAVAGKPGADNAALNSSRAVQELLEGMGMNRGAPFGFGPYDVKDVIGPDGSNGKYVAFTVFSTTNYIKYRAQLLQETRTFYEAFGQSEMVLDPSSGTFKPGPKLKEKFDKWKKKQLEAKNAGNRVWHKKKPDYKGLLKIRLENSQALLIQGMHKMVRLNGVLPTLKDKVTNKRSTASQGELSQMIPECLKTYVSEPQSLVDLLANPYGVEEFLCARPADLAFLQPRLQFYLNDVPVEFPDYTDGNRVVQVAKARLSNAESLQKIFNSTGVKGSDVGVKNFSWSFNNKHHGDSTVRASLTLYFANTTELLNQQYLKFVFGGRTDTAAHRARARKAKKGTGLDASQLEEMLTSRTKVMSESDAFYGDESPYDGDLVEAKALGTRRADPPPQLKVQVGWSVPNDKDGSLSAKFKEGVVRSQRLLNLHLWQYQINFGETGDVTLSLDYIGGIDEFLSTPDKSNIFDTALDMTTMHTRKTLVSTGQKLIKTGGSSSVFDLFGGLYAGTTEMSPISGEVQLSKTVWPKGYLRKQLNNGSNLHIASDGTRRVGVAKGGLLYELETLRLWKKSLIAKGGKKPPPSVSEQIKKVTGYMKPLRQAIAEVDRSHGDLVYSSFITRLVSTGKLYYATARKNLIDGSGIYDEVKNTSRTPFGNRITLGTTFAPAPNRKKGWDIDVRGGRPASAGGVNAISERFQRVINHNSGLRTQGNFSRTAFNFLDPTQQDGQCLEPGVDEEASILYYMKLGDILDIILCGLQKKPTAPEAEYILGSFYPHLLGIPHTSAGELYSLRDIPISLDYFGHWFMKSFLTKSTKPKASFKRFADSLMTDLVAPLFNRVLRDSAANNLGRMEFGFTSLASPTQLNPSPLVSANNLRNVAQDKRRGNNASLKQSQYYLMYVKQLNPKLQGIRNEDHARGIYHLVLGADRGLVKSFAFSQVDLPYYKEMMIEQGNFAEGLFIPQNVNITMVGNTFFRNGQTIYVNTDFGLGAAAQKLGIGGYYTVTRVENTIEVGRFETRIQCTFVKRLGG